MRRVALLAAVLLVVAATPHAAADHVDTGEFQQGRGFTEDQWDEGVYDCGGSIPSSQAPGFVNASEADGWLEDGDVVIGVAANGTAKAYPFSNLSTRKVVDDEVGSTPVVTWFRSDGQAFERPTGRNFTWVGNATIEDDQGNRYDAVTGVSHGSAPDLEQIGTVDLSWFAWLDHHPSTQLYTGNGTVPIEGHQPPDNAVPGTGVFHALAVLGLASLALAVTRGSGRS